MIHSVVDKRQSRRNGRAGVLDAVKACTEILDDVLCVLEADTKTEHTLADACLCQLLRGVGAVGHGCRMLD